MPTRLVVLALLPLAVAACRTDTDPTHAARGTYVLETVNAQRLPVSFGPANAGPWFIAGSLALRADGTYTQTVVDSSRCCGVDSVTEHGTWSARAGTVHLAPTTDGRDPSDARLESDGLERAQFSRTFRFRRQ